MTISIWRYSHLTLAVSSFLLLTLASISGIFLAFEPIMERAKGYRIEQFDTVSLAQTIPVLKAKYPKIQELTVDENDFVAIKYADEKGNDKQAYVNPVTGSILGTPQKKAALFRWMTALHRSLFLHETGRAIVGIVSFLLILMALSGVALIVQRQNGFRRFFAPIEKASFAQYYHTVFGRITLVFMLAIAVSGSYLSASRFIIKPHKISAKVDEDKIKEEPERTIAQFSVFGQTKLADVEKVEFPFSDFPEDYYKLKLYDRELCVNQITGDVLAQSVYPKSYTLTSFSLRWHTGRSHPAWAIILAITAAYILFFIYSGFVITWKRISGRVSNSYKSDESKFIILVGSENGSTMRVANGIYQQLTSAGQSTYVTALNKYNFFPKAEHIIVLTSTYGLGNAPSNAGNFAALLLQYPQAQQVYYSVLGFGSQDYPDFCRFGFEVNNLLSEQNWAKPLLEIHTVNDQSIDEMVEWFREWVQKAKLPSLQLPASWRQKPSGLTEMSVVSKTSVAGQDGSFILTLKPKNRTTFTSGDLLGIYPADDYRERLYSIGRIGTSVQLSVRLHPSGLGSGYLYGLSEGSIIQSRIVTNAHFHFPDKANTVVMISNGTGIAPFLGMIDQNAGKLPCHLYCGFRDQASIAMYQSVLDGHLSTGQLEKLHFAYSRQGAKQYVSDLLKQDADFILGVLADEGVIMLCGSLSMQKDVTEWLHLALGNGEKGFSYYQSHGRVLMDCY